MKDDAFAQSLTGATTNLRDADRAPEQGRGHGRQADDRPGAVQPAERRSRDRLDQTAGAARTTGEGTAGQLLKDKQLYENMNGAVADLRGLVDAIKKDPKKYLNVKVSIF